MKLHVTHRTRFAYGAPARDSFNEARLRPTSAGRQVCHEFELQVQPEARTSHYVDLYQNWVHLFDVCDPHRALVVTSTSTVETDDAPQAPGDLVPPVSTRELAGCARLERCHDFLQSSRYVHLSPQIWRLALDYTAGVADVWSLARTLMQRVHEDFQYQPNATHVNTDTDEVLRWRKGVCQDFAHVMIGLCRSLKMPARYVSGYLYNGPENQLKGAQASHAWVEVYLPGHGWFALDPTNNQVADGTYVKVATGRDYADVSPLRGTYRGTPDRQLTVDVLVRNLGLAASSAAGPSA